MCRIGRDIEAREHKQPKDGGMRQSDGQSADPQGAELSYEAKEAGTHGTPGDHHRSSTGSGKKSLR